MRARLGPEWEAFQEALAKPPRTTIRLHPEKGKNLYPEASPVSWHPRGRVLAERPNFALEPAWHAGAYYVQEASSMSVRVFLPERRPLRVIDLSAAPGGKSTLLLDELGLTGGLLIANDPDSHRRAALAENLARWAIPAYLITGRDPAWWAEHYPSAFDAVLLDAPCSGEGLWRKTPSLSQTWRPEEVHFCSRRQRRLLSAAKTLVAPGGHLIYSTCTFAPEENEDNLSAFFAEGPGMVSPSLGGPSPPGRGNLLRWRRLGVLLLSAPHHRRGVLPLCLAKKARPRSESARQIQSPSRAASGKTPTPPHRRPTRFLSAGRNDIHAYRVCL
jgi:16S rRNA C967 or C1407 C5-methylase (RsmB/RsmF family)